ncbi:nucleoside phosphorylase [Clostridium sporogenes]|uniref:nucleoside phosphorylase n=1 Tax=Clostridium sporogenes TaxID=1509 RepID=UPI0005EF6BA3|nr:nucleoside phosphorylase [Clostridium sporogenes]NFF79149.1 nucleoside phosphorylase [Clostridium sporogenes]NFL79654.1 nucleoside phosphorylase [Clostridium sporogenes]NFU39260.1 nucleoside phosphorylase [Clostridium sporogenes]NFU79167.1 nucleoside phosphorylase [Clostridium sporogenes]
MVYDETLQKHIRCKIGDVAEYVLIPGDPARAKKIAEEFDTYEKIAENREYVVYTGIKDGIKLSVCSTGIGGASTAIAMEELSKLGAHTFIRVGSAGGRKETIPVGSVVVVNAAVRGEGTSKEYLPEIYPAVADLNITNALLEAGREYLKEEECYAGMSLTRDAYYMQNQSLNDQLMNTQVAVSEMECATVFIVAAKRGLKAGAVVGTDSNIIKKHQLTLEEKDRLYWEAEKKTINIAVNAMVKLAKLKK